MNFKKVQDALLNVREHGWQVVDLRNCGLKNIPKELYNHKDIKHIDLGNSEHALEKEKNKILHIPEEISKIIGLRTLNLENNLVESISENITELQNLSNLNLKNNNLKDLSAKIVKMRSLKELEIAHNPFELLPPEIVARGINSIKNFYEELEEKDFLYEVKLIIVGEGRVGKTCISKALMEKDFVLGEQESTEGINIGSWIIEKEEIQKVNKSIERDFQINIWDFGGQEIYHSTHQFFLTKRSIYLLVTESRKEDSHDDFFYWLNIIKLLGDNSPVIMALNKCDQPTKELPIKEYQRSFDNIMSFDKISLMPYYRDDFKKFRMNLIQRASNLPHIGTPLPKVWVEIRQEIERLTLSGLNYITQNQYFEICKKHYRKEDSALFLSEFFHDLGVIIHFQDDMELKDLVILNNEWITKGVYKVLDDEKVIEQKGRFSNSDLLRIWSGDEYSGKERELLSLMKNNKFDLCFELTSGDYLVPRLLPVDEVMHKWESKPSNTKFEFRYKFLPKGILTRLIVKMNSDIHNEKYWRYGVILEYDETFAIIREKYFQNKITIELSGENRREFLFMIRKALNEIHSDFNKLDFEEMIPCNCDMCLSLESPHFYEFSLLKRYEREHLKKIRCDVSLKEVGIFDLTNDVVRKALSEEMLIACENKNSDILNDLELKNKKFFPEKNSAGVFIKTITHPDWFGLRDRDFLIDSEIERIQSKYPNYYILEYYCFENYLYHPDNIAELNLKGLEREVYLKEVIKQKNLVKNVIISNFKGARKSYQEFQIDSDSIRDKKNEHEIIDYLESNDPEIFLKAFNMKDKFNKDFLCKYQLTHKLLSETNWFRSKIENVMK